MRRADHTLLVVRTARRGRAGCRVFRDERRPWWRRSRPSWPVHQEAEEAGEWLLAARSLNNLYNLLPGGPADWAAALERMRTFAERAGFESLAVAAYFQGRARLAVQAGNLGVALAELEAARRRDRGLLRTRNGSDYHGVLFAGLLLEAGELDKVDIVIRGLIEHSTAAYPMLTQTSVPGLQFHVACRLGRGEQARELLHTVVDAVRATGVTGRDFAHDLISAGLSAGLTADELRPIATAIDHPLFDDAYRWLADAQIAEAAGDTADALRLNKLDLESRTQIAAWVKSRAAAS
ncbi:hypothetical protein [Dactylosporangium sp. NPDC051484]|uniref:hypothetical protein n=1 Tax=Dactylosporangium sp. NPDC051484 TaxID=3154942 RepID=UPI00344D5724